MASSCCISVRDETLPSCSGRMWAGTTGQGFPSVSPGVSFPVLLSSASPLPSRYPPNGLLSPTRSSHRYLRTSILPGKSSRAQSQEEVGIAASDLCPFAALLPVTTPLGLVTPAVPVRLLRMPGTVNRQEIKHMAGAPLNLFHMHGPTCAAWPAMSFGAPSLLRTFPAAVSVTGTCFRRVPIARSFCSRQVNQPPHPPAHGDGEDHQERRTATKQCRPASSPPPEPNQQKLQYKPATIEAAAAGRQLPDRP